MSTVAGLTGSAREQGLFVLSLLLLVLGTAALVMAVRHPRARVVAAATGAAGIVGWLLCNGAREGRTLLLVLPGNGVTAADLLALPATVLLGVVVLRDARNRR